MIFNLNFSNFSAKGIQTFNVEKFFGLISRSNFPIFIEAVSKRNGIGIEDVSCHLPKVWEEEYGYPLSDGVVFYILEEEANFAVLHYNDFLELINNCYEQFVEQNPDSKSGLALMMGQINSNGFLDQCHKDYFQLLQLKQLK